ncbi:hypothetical protein SAMN05444671_0196 [Flavobacterium sp. CF108]|uniref:hypothetical protein n=1 Tax=unclassified Flavobacterium TaxID=196869 RepID=UPI0008B231BF|nr:MULTISPECIES: hypothetical protein [unclassified Flavobacterium]SEO63753.1 hypothetical protein SAMN04487978_3276 [Flavobacterium sp. fv08]SHI06696.1 hypothetical protein SAMN05444671_0196 [Flavobacterium sp. CF108]
MFISLTHDQVQFQYGSKQWQYNFNEIVELGLLKKKKTYLFENGAFMAVTVLAYYCMIFTNVMELYYLIPTLLCYSFLIILRFNNKTEFDYFVIVKDIYKKETKVKINALDRPVIGKQIDQYLNFQFERILKTTN